jgi:hypothetical protein
MHLRCRDAGHRGALPIGAAPLTEIASDAPSAPRRMLGKRPADITGIAVEPGRRSGGRRAQNHSRWRDTPVARPPFTRCSDQTYPVRRFWPVWRDHPRVGILTGCQTSADSALPLLLCSHECNSIHLRLSIHKVKCLTQLYSQWSPPDTIFSRHETSILLEDKGLTIIQNSIRCTQETVPCEVRGALCTAMKGSLLPRSPVMWRV